MAFDILLGKKKKSLFRRLTSYIVSKLLHQLPSIKYLIKTLRACACVCMHVHILKFTQNGVTMTTGSCVSVPMGKRERAMSASIRWEPVRAELYNGCAT